ncbi:hypothetical protein RAS1_28590 [Phycisphaerae bacterium RAS1]|nr:hypothetical protein RAS1_28590 [Phycisphaerae bacterium RAS1]
MSRINPPKAARTISIPSSSPAAAAPETKVTFRTRRAHSPFIKPVASALCGRRSAKTPRKSSSATEGRRYRRRVRTDASAAAGNGLAIAAFLFATLAVAPLGEAAADDASLARHTPANVGLFVELRKLDGLLVDLLDAQLWLTLADLAGQPAREDEPEEWQRRVRHAIQMDPTEAIKALFADRVAFVGDAPWHAQDAAVLCRPPTDVKELLKRWKPAPLPYAGRASVYRLPGSVGLGRFDDLLMFGDPRPIDGSFQQMLNQADLGGPTLADDPVYSQLLARTPPSADGVLFARLRPVVRIGGAGGSASQPATSPATRASRPLDVLAGELPGPLRGASNVLLSLHREGPRLHVCAVGDGPPRAPRPAALYEMVRDLPARTLLARAATVDFPALFDAAQKLPERNPARLAVSLLGKAGVLERLEPALGSDTCIAIGVVAPENRLDGAPPAPAAALMIRTRNARAALAEFTSILESLSGLYNLLAIRNGWTALDPLRTINAGPADARMLDLTPLLPAAAAGLLGPVRITCLVDNDVLIIATHEDWIRQIVEAREGRSPRLAEGLQLSRQRIGPGSDSIIFAQTGPFADLSVLWLDFVGQLAPQALGERFWRELQPAGRNVRLGIQATELSDARALRVDSVNELGPASGVLRIGDRILGCNQRRFATTQPVVEFQRGLIERPEARFVELIVQRDDISLVRRVPLPFIDPVQLLRRAVSIGKAAQRVVYHDDSGDAAGPRGFLTIELRRPGDVVYSFDEPTSQPARSEDSVRE